MVIASLFIGCTRGILQFYPTALISHFNSKLPLNGIWVSNKVHYGILHIEIIHYQQESKFKENKINDNIIPR